MLLNSPKPSNAPVNDENINETQPVFQPNQRRNRGLSRLFGCCCKKDDEEDPCPGNRGISLSTILFFVLIFLILFYND